MDNWNNWTSAVLAATGAFGGGKLVLGLFAAVGILMAASIFFAASSRKQKKAAALAKEESEGLKKQLSDTREELEGEKRQGEAVRERCEELRRLEEKSRKLATTDHVTGLPNRMAFVEIVDGVLKTLRKDELFAVMYIDIDDFKRINETLGRSYGDELLIDVADRMRQFMDENDFFACFGGDEFVVLSQNIGDMDLYEEKLKKIQNVFSYPFVLVAKEIFVTVSIGIALAPKDGKTLQTIFKNLDSALYQAKNNGKNNYCYYDEAISKGRMSQIELHAQLRNAMENKEFSIYYQPLVSLESGDLEGFEATLRWNHPVRGLLPPEEFMPTADSTGLIVDIGKWMFRQVCQKLGEWKEAGLGSMKVAMALSGRQFRDWKLSERTAEILAETGANPGQVIMEITEDIALEDLEYTVETIGSLKKLGVGFSLNDFGSGYSSLHYLKRLPVDCLKLDRRLMDGISEEREDGAVVGAVISLAKAFHFDVAAQGVESQSQESFLRQAGCSMAQGFLYSEPMQEDAAAHLLEIIKEGGKMEDAVWL